MSNSWGSYPSAFNLGHRAIKDLFTVPVYIEEKVDGSQFNFGLIADEEGEYQLRIKSKKVEMYPAAPEKMFTKAAETVIRLHEKGLLHPGWTYRSEYLAKPMHNALAYDRVPKDHLILFDVSTGDGEFLDRWDKEAEAERLGLEVVPVLWHADVMAGNPDEQQLRYMLDNYTSVLGGQKIEGVFIKQTGDQPYLYGTDKKVLMGKFVSEAFREVHKKAWGESNPSRSDFIERLAEMYTTPARWHKAVQHLAEAGELNHSPQDIGKIIKEIPEDTFRECAEEIQQQLMEHFWPQIRRMIVRGFPEWYKDQLFKRQFQDNESEVTVDV